MTAPDPRLQAEKRAGKGTRSAKEAMDPDVGGRKNRAQKLKEQEAEIEVLKRRLELDGNVTLTQWEKMGSQEMRDEFAARAYFQTWGSGEKSLLLLGFNRKDAQNEKLQTRILETPGVQSIVGDAFRPAKEQKADMVQRMVRIARFGDDDSAVRAFAQLARVEQWIKNEPGASPVSVNLYGLAGINQQPALTEKRVDALEQSADPLALLSHEPGEPVRITTGDEFIDDALKKVDD